MCVLRFPLRLLLGGAWLAAVGCGSGGGSRGGGIQPLEAAEIRLGERLFRETRFAQSFAARVVGRALNDPLSGHDPVVDVVDAFGTPVPGPYAGRAMSCAACHLSEELAAVAGAGVRAYCDFSSRSPTPDRGDGHARTARNTPPLRDAALPREIATFFHDDGEFETLEDLAGATLGGRNLGWQPTEHPAAVSHVARVVREDDGADANAADHGGGSYASVLSGQRGLAPDGALLPVGLRADVATATDDELLDAVSRLLGVYVRSLALAPDGGAARTVRSAYDVFVEKNGLPSKPGPGETSQAYAHRLRTALLAIASPLPVGPGDGVLRTHPHPFVFGELERRGLLVFLTAPGDLPPGPPPSGGVGSCAVCHAPPSFSDFGFHNVGASQVEYDAVHGLGAFSLLAVPSLATRSLDPNRYLPPSSTHPLATGVFRSAPVLADPEASDLGLWNVFANPDVPGPQAALRAVVLARLGLPATATDAELLPQTIGWLKTPPLRDLGHSAPYFHGGHVLTLLDAVQHYRAASLSARFGLVRNAALELSGIVLDVDDLSSLIAFLQSLDEDPP